MKIAFYYHIPILSKKDKIYMPGFLGVFIDSLAAEVTELCIVMHEAHGTQVKDCDYEIKQSNIKWINLGKRSPAWSRTFFSSYYIKKKMNAIEHCDALIVRSPTPLAPHFYKFVKNPKIYFMIVGSYLDDSGHLKFSTFRNRIIYYYLHYYDSQFTSRILETDILVNSPLLFEKYKSVAKSIYQIRTTTLSDTDFYQREDTCLNKSINLLYTGRIDPAKGLTELVYALHNLREQNIDVVLYIVGWEDALEKPYENQLKKLASELKISKFLIFSGKKKIGEELNAMYKMADIYVLPSYYEGFPRTIWEAMANCLPVIATRVGGIPKTLSDQENVLLIEPKNIQQISEAVINILKNKIFRQKLIVNGYNTAKDNTLEKQTKYILNYLSEDIKTLNK